MPHSSLQTSIAIERDHFKVELNNQKVSYSNLLKENEKLQSIIDVKNGQLAKQKELTADLQRSTSQSTRTINALKKELRAAEAAEKTAKEYSRLVERKIAGSCSKVLVEKCGSLKKKLNEANTSLAERDRDCNIQHEQLEKAEKEIRVLLRALEIRTDELGLGSDSPRFEDGYFNHHQHDRGAEVRAGMLYELSRAQEQSQELELKLEESISKNEQLRLDHNSLVSRYDAEQKLRSKAERNIEDLKKQLTRQQQDFDSIMIEKESLERDLQGTYRTIESQSEQITHLEAKHDHLDSKLKGSLKQLQQEEEAHKEALSALKAKVIELSTNSSQKSMVANQAHSRSIEEHQRALAAEKRLEELTSAAKADRKTRDEALSEVQRQKQLCDKYEEKLKIAIEKIEELHHKLGILEHELGEERSHRLLKHSEAERVSQDHAHALSQLEAVKSELSVVESKKDHLKNTVESETNQVRSLQTKIEEITKSKELLQRAMLEQLSHARRELREERERNSSGQLPIQFSRKLEVLASETGRLEQLLQQPLHTSGKMGQAMTNTSQNYTSPSSLDVKLI